MSKRKKKLSECKTTSWLKDSIAVTEEEFELIKMAARGRNITKLSRRIQEGTIDKNTGLDLLIKIGEAIVTESKKLKGEIKMKKKVKFGDITIGEALNVCSNMVSCSKCPFEVISQFSLRKEHGCRIVKTFNLIDDKYLEDEIEIEEKENDQS